MDFVTSFRLHYYHFLHEPVLFFFDLFHIQRGISANGNIEEIFLSVNYNEFYRFKYFFNIYQKIYSEKKELK
jgi:hypothetical protein